MNHITHVFLIGGGMTFKNKKEYLDFLKNRPVSIEKKKIWSGDYLDKELGRKFSVIRPRMPLQDNAQYEEWKIAFERYIPLLKRGVVLIGVSLGGIFLAKYLSENKFPKKISATFLICPPYDNSLPDEDLVGGFELGKDLSLLEKNTKNLFLLFSKDDTTVPPSVALKYESKLKKARIIMYKSKKGHFRVEKFPELVKMIKESVI